MLLTPNRRLALFLQKQEPQASIFSFQQWIESLWLQLKQDQSTALPSLITPYAETLLWETIITESPSVKTLLRIPQTARLAKEAYHLIRHWKLSNLEKQAESEGCLIYLEWLASYQQKLKQAHWIDSADVLEILIEHLPLCISFLPKQIECIEFHEWTPVEKDFLEALQNLNISVSHKTLSRSFSPEISVMSFDTKEQELREVTKQIAAYLNTHKTAYIGVVIQDLEQRREEVQLCFQECLPENSFNIAAPIPLSEHPLMKSQFLAFSFILKEIPLENWSRLLRSPFFVGGLEDQSLLAYLDELLHKRKNTHYTLEEVFDLFQKAEENSDRQPPKLLLTFENVIPLRKMFSGKKKTEKWVDAFKLWLQTFGFGLGRPFDPAEQKISEASEAIWEQYLALDPLLGPHTFLEALSHLQRLADHFPFTPKLEKEARIHALGLLEAIGLSFDKLWVLGLTQDIWPKMPNPNPFIPLNVQRKWNLPRSSATRELQMAKHFTEELSKGALEVVFSFPTRREEEPLKMSPLLLGFPYHPHIPKNETISVSASAYHSTLSVNSVPFSGKKSSIHALTLQAQCPFRAFSEIRLQATSFSQPTRYLSKSERGEIIHEILYLFWREVKNSRALAALSSTALDSLVHRCLSSVLNRWAKKYPKRLTANYQAIEHKRLEKIISKWILLEKERPPFEIMALEFKQQINDFPLSFSVRVDRMDKLENNDLFIIDYKTGRLPTLSVANETMIEPQLPLYSFGQETLPAGLSYVLLKSDELKYQGISKYNMAISGIKTLPNWDELHEQWKQSITNLSLEFKEGYAEVKPLLGEATCRGCQLHSLCRINDVSSF